MGRHRPRPQVTRCPPGAVRYGAGVASVAECRAALDRLAARLAANSGQVRRKVDVDRTLVCRITDLDVAFRGRLAGGELVDVTEGDDPAAQISLAASSDDLVALIDGDLDVSRALASRRVSLQASPWDLLKLRRLL